MTTLLPTRAPGAEAVPVSVTWREVGEVAVVTVTGDLDIAGIAPVGSVVREALATRPIGLVLDLAGVPFCDTVGLRLLLSSAAQARAQGCAPAVTGVQRRVAEFLSRVCADRTLPGYPDVSAAIEGLMFSAEWR